MKLATIKNKNRDGQLVVVSKDLMHAVLASDVAETLQQALDTWQQSEPKLEAYYRKLNHHEIKNPLMFSEHSLHRHFQEHFNGPMVVPM